MPAALMKSDLPDLPVEELRLELRRAVLDAGGNTQEAFRRLGLTHRTGWRLLHKADIAHELAPMRRTLKARYRLPAA